MHNAYQIFPDIIYRHQIRNEIVYCLITSFSFPQLTHPGYYLSFLLENKSSADVDNSHNCFITAGTPWNNYNWGNFPVFTFRQEETFKQESS